MSSNHIRPLVAGWLMLFTLHACADDGFAQVGELKMYYQIQGTGRPLVLLHGGLCTIERCMGKLRTALGAGWKTVALEQQGHGRTADLDRPLTFDQMAHDTAAALRQLKIERADFIGYSDGGNVALRLAMLHPKLVRKIVVIGTNLNNAGLVPGLLDAFRTIKPDDIPADYRLAYARVAHDRGKWPVLVTKVMRQGIEFGGWDEASLKALTLPVLLVIGDRDIVTPQHAVEMSRVLPNASLAILPGTGHEISTTRADWIARMASDFLLK